MNNFNPHDKYFNKAKAEGYRARSAFKLESIDRQFQLIKPGMTVLDLGAAPGSFMQYIAKRVGEKGMVIGIDLQAIEPLRNANVFTYQADIFDDDMYKKILQKRGIEHFDLITSDLAPKTTGVRFMDGGASLELNLQVLEVAKQYLRRGGVVVMKVLTGFNEGELIGPVKEVFKVVKKLRPDAVRKSSDESYLICRNKV